jgi:alpha-1,3-rhamnosyl/mannosyltransferase
MNRSKRIFIDIDPLAQPHITGVAKVTAIFTREIVRRTENKGVELDLAYSDPLKRRPLQLGPEITHAPHVTIRVARLLVARVYVKLNKYHLAPPFNFFVPYFHRYNAAFFPNFAIFPMWPRPRSFVIIHDLAFLSHPEHIQARNLPYMQKIVPRAVKNAYRIICVSETIKQEIIKTYAINENRVLVVPVTPEQKKNLEDKKRVGELLAQYDLQNRHFFMFVGTIEPRKNLVGLLDAYALLPARLRNSYPLVLVGPKGWKDEVILQKIHDLKKSGARIVQTGFVSDIERDTLYASATAFCFVSFDEGFGIPVAESFLYGTPVIASDIPTLREIGGDAALYCDPHEPKTIAATMEQLVNGKILKSQLDQAMKRQLAHAEKRFEESFNALINDMLAPGKTK